MQNATKEDSAVAVHLPRDPALSELGAVVGERFRRGGQDALANT